MWVNSKEAAEILGVKYETIKKATQRAERAGKKICLIGCNISHFTYTDGIGRGGKTLQIWIDDAVANDDPSKKEPDDEKNSLDRGLDHSRGSDSAAFYSAVDSTVSGGYIMDGSGNDERGGDSRNLLCGAQACEKIEAKSASQDQVKIKIEDLENMNKLKAVRELKNCPKGMSKTMWGQGVAKKYGVSLKTLYAWAKLNKKEDVEIEDDELSIDFRASFKSSSFEMKALEWATGFMLHNPLSSKRFVYEKLEIYAKEKDLNIGSYQSFARLTASAEIKAMLLRATAGDRGVRNEIASHIIRDLNCYESMELVCGDQIVFDFDAIGPDGEVLNPNAYVWIDMGSGAIIGIDVTFGKYNRLSVGRSLKSALRFGMADAIYTDNGKPELSNYIEQVRSQLSGIKFRDFDDLAPNMIHKKAKPGNSRAKPIENIFNHVQRRMSEIVFFERGGAGYHKDKRGDTQEIIKKYMKENPLNYEDFISYFEQGIRWWNEHYNESRKIHPMKSFLEKLEAKPKAVFDETTLDFIFSERRAIKVKNSGVTLTIMGQKRTYSHPKLCKFNGENVEVRINENDYERVNIVDMDSHRALCEANIIDRIDPRDHEKVKAQIAKNEAVVKAVKAAFGYYSNLYKKPSAMNAYTSVAHEAKVKNEKTRKISKKIAMSNEELLNAM